jgi:peptide/nickel transport system permease protein
MARTKTSKKPLVLILIYLAAGAAMIFLSYSLPRMLPGDFITAMYASSHVTLNEQQEAELKAYYTQEQSFADYVSKLFRLDWGYSYAFLTPVSSLILESLPWTLLLMGSAHLVSMILGFMAGVEAAWRRGKVSEKMGVGFMTLLEGVPEIASGVVLLLVFALHLGWFPAAGAETVYAQQTALQRLGDIAHHLALPLATLIIAYFPGNFLLARGSLIMVLKSDFIRTARAKGLPAWRIRYAHAARNALLPMFTRFGLRIAFMVTGALVVETIHSYPGLGTLLFNAISVRDLPLIQGIVLFSSLLMLAVNLGLEFTYGLLDPRLRHAS